MLMWQFQAPWKTLGTIATNGTVSRQPLKNIALIGNSSKISLRVKTHKAKCSDTSECLWTYFGRTLARLVRRHGPTSEERQDQKVGHNNDDSPRSHSAEILHDWYRKQNFLDAPGFSIIFFGDHCHHKEVIQWSSYSNYPGILYIWSF